MPELVVVDTSALLKNGEVFNYLRKRYKKIIVPLAVVNELDNIKNRRTDKLSKKAWEILSFIGNNADIVVMSAGNSFGTKEYGDNFIIRVAEKAAGKYGCCVNILTDDIDYSVFLKAVTDKKVFVLHLERFMLEMQNAASVDPLELRKAVEYNGPYNGQYVLTADEANAYLSDGNTLMIATVRAKNMSTEQKIRKISWLISQGADVNARDHGRRFFPALMHAVQMGNFELFRFLLWECHADPNVGSREFLERGKVRYRNEGNMPLMVAAWDGKLDFIRELLKINTISINQQDANGFTALMKAAMNGHKDCYEELLRNAADVRIRDIDGRTAADWLNWYGENGVLRKTYRKAFKQNSRKTDERRKY